MSSFVTPLVLEYLDGRTWRLSKTFEYAVNGDRIVVPAGFETDFASVPRMFWRVLPPTGQYGKAAVVHDYLYRTPGHEGYSRAAADRVFFDAMGVLGVGKLTRYTMYYAVRMAAVGAWHD